MKKFISIRTKFIYLLNTIAIVAMGLSAFSIISYVSHTRLNVDVNQLTNLSKIMGKNLIASISFEQKDSAKTILESLIVNDNISGAFIFQKTEEFTSYINKRSNKKRKLINCPQTISMSHAKLV